MNLIKKQNVFGWITWAAAVIAIVALIVYIVNCTTGYYASSGVNALVIVFTIISIILLAAAPFLSGKMDDNIPAVAILIAAVLMSVCACTFIIQRLSLFADMWFIPTTPPAAESAMLPSTMVGIILYFVTAVVSIVPVFAPRLAKKKA